MFCVKCVDRPIRIKKQRSNLEKLIRSFIAIPLNSQIHQNLADFCHLHGLDNRNYGLKPVQAANIHLTIKFLGEIDQHRVKELSSALNQVASRLAPFKVYVRGVGAYPAWNRNPRVIWVGSGPIEPLQKVFSLVEIATVSLNFPPEKRGFSPHLTLARVNTQTDQLAAIINRLSRLTPEPFFGEMEMKGMVLFKSVLLPQGPVYTALSSHIFTQ